MQEREPRPYERAPDELKTYNQWVNWRWEENRKVPVNPFTLGNAGVNWANTWASFDIAQTAADHFNFGLGFVLTEDDQYTVVDLDDCVGERGNVSPETRYILDLLCGWVELSPSETGLHIWVRNEHPVNRRTHGIEVYSSARWISITGSSNPKPQLVIPERTAAVAELMGQYFPKSKREFVALTPLSEDGDIWQRLFDSDHGAFFQSLYHGDISVCYDDHSRAVIMLCNALVAQTSGDAVRVKRLLYQTNLVRDKWEERRGNITWIDYQIQDALAYVSGRK